MVTQHTLREVVKLTKELEANKSKLDELKAGIAKAVLAGDTQETGPFEAKVSHIVRPSTSWKSVVDRLEELDPLLGSKIAAIVKSPKITTVSEFDKVEVKATVDPSIA
jgi:hypothetical protein